MVITSNSEEGLELGLGLPQESEIFRLSKFPRPRGLERGAMRVDRGTPRNVVVAVSCRSFASLQSKASGVVCHNYALTPSTIFGSTAGFHYNGPRFPQAKSTPGMHGARVRDSFVWFLDISDPFQHLPELRVSQPLLCTTWVDSVCTSGLGGPPGSGL